MHLRCSTSTTSSYGGTTQNDHFTKMMRNPENLECFECGAKRPTWASTNLGIFFCLRCAGIHRALGTHITKVKSINMDTWDDSSINFIQHIGNARGKTLYEYKMLDIDRPNVHTSSSDLEKLLRIKYEKKAYYHPNYKELIMEYMNSDIEYLSIHRNGERKASETIKGKKPKADEETKQSAPHHPQPNLTENLFEQAGGTVPIPSLFCEPVELPNFSTPGSNGKLVDPKRRAEVLDLFSDANRAPPLAENVWSGTLRANSGPSPYVPASTVSIRASTNNFGQSAGSVGRQSSCIIPNASLSYMASLDSKIGLSPSTRAPPVVPPTFPASDPHSGVRNHNAHPHINPSSTLAPPPSSSSVGTKEIVRSLFSAPPNPSEAAYSAWKPRKAEPFYSPNVSY